VTSTPTASSGSTTPVDDAVEGAPEETPAGESPSPESSAQDPPTAGTASAGSPPDPLAPGSSGSASPASSPPASASPAESPEEGEPEPAPRHLAEEAHARHLADDQRLYDPTRRRRARRRAWILSSTLAVLLLGAIAAGAYLWQVAEAWEARDAEWRGHAETLGGDLASTRGELADTMAELEVVRGQLDQAQRRISELADEKARLGDEHAVVRQLADYQERVSQVATTVVAALDACIASQQRLVIWYAAADEAAQADEDADPAPVAPDRAQLVTLTARVDEVCRAAQEAKDALQEELDG